MAPRKKVMTPTIVAGMLEDGLEAPSSIAWTAAPPSFPTRPWTCPTISPRTASAPKASPAIAIADDEDRGQREQGIVREGRAQPGTLSFHQPARARRRTVAERASFHGRLLTCAAGCPPAFQTGTVPLASSRTARVAASITMIGEMIRQSIRLDIVRKG